MRLEVCFCLRMLIEVDEGTVVLPRVNEPASAVGVAATVVAHVEDWHHALRLDQMLVRGEKHLIAAGRDPDSDAHTCLLEAWQLVTSLCDEPDQLGRAQRIDVVTFGASHLKRLEALGVQVPCGASEPFHDRIDVVLGKVARAVYEPYGALGNGLANEGHNWVGVDLVVEGVDPVHAHKRLKITARANAAAQLATIGVLQPAVSADEAEEPSLAQDVETVVEETNVKVAAVRHRAQCLAVCVALVPIDVACAHVGWVTYD